MDIALITYPVETNPAGIGVYVQNIAKNLIAADSDNTYFLLHFSRSTHPLYNRNEILYPHHRRLPVMLSDSLYLRRNPKRFDIVHRFSPGGFIFRIESKIVITVHDLFLYKRYPFNRKTRNAFANRFIRSSLERADAIVAVSHFTREEVLQTFRVKDRKVYVVHCAPGIILQNLERGQRVLKDKYGMDKAYILFVSTIEPRKNLITLVKASEELKERHGLEEHLVIVGKPGWDFHGTLKYIGASKHRDSIRLMGFVPDEDLSCFYGNAALFVYPSLMEGFGMPPLEAMACGCPTLTSNTSSLPEVVADEGMMFDPLDRTSLVHKMLSVLTDEDYRNENIRRGLQNVKRFDWQASAEQIRDIYSRL